MDRISLHNKFEEILKSKNVYFQSPPDVLMKYPAIRYSIDDIDISHADGINYKQFNKYSSNLNFLTLLTEMLFAIASFTTFE